MNNMTTYSKLKHQFGYCEGMVGKNEDKEDVIVTIDKENATVVTVQANGWHRINTYWPDGTEEETYRKK